MDKDDLRGAPAAIGVVVLALLFLGVIVAIYPGLDIVMKFIFDKNFFMVEAFISLVFGILTGLYSGAIVSRINRFSSLKSELLSVLNDIEYISGDEREKNLCSKSVKSIRQVGSDFFRFGHLKAGVVAFDVAKEINDKFYLYIQNKCGENSLDETIEKARLKIRSADYTRKVFLPYGYI